MNALDKLTKARANLIIDQPFFGTLALRLHLQEAPNIATLCVDGRTVFYNPEFIESLSLQLVKSAIAHEVMHCVFDHMSRLQGRNPSKWNAATDYAINPILKDAGFKLGEKWLYNPSWAGKTADEIYTILQDDKDDADGSGHQALDELAPPDPNATGTSSSPEEMRLEWKLTVASAAETAKQKGKLPASLQRFVDQATGNRVDWRGYLWRFATEVSKNDYSWLRPNLKYLTMDLYLPSMFSEGMGTMVVAIDTSGSVSPLELKVFSAEISALRDQLMPELLYVVYCDAAVQRVDEFYKYDEFKIDAIGGGGTDFCPVFEYLQKNHIDPACLVYLTDMYGRFPTKEAPYPVLWCATSEVIAPWGRTVMIDATTYS